MRLVFSNSIVIFISIYELAYINLQGVPETGSFLGLSFRTSRTQNEIPLLDTFVFLGE